MKVLVTGGTGFIGSHLVEALLAQGHEVRCLVRDPASPRWLAGLPVSLVRGDCTEPDTLPSAVRDADWVFHAAGLVKARTPREFYRVNAQGTAHLVRACLRHASRLSRFLYVSSLAASGPSPDGTPVREEDPCRPINDYGRSKRQGEEAILRCDGELPWIIVRPPAIYGPRDRAFLPFFRLAGLGLFPRFPGEKRASLCYITDLIAGIVKAVRQAEAIHRIYFIADPRPCSWSDLYEALAAASRRRMLRVPVPAWLLYAAAWGSEMVGILRGRPAFLSRQKARELLQPQWLCDVSRAQRELNFAAEVPLHEGVQRTWAWYVRHGWLPGASNAKGGARGSF